MSIAASKRIFALVALVIVFVGMICAFVPSASAAVASDKYSWYAFPSKTTCRVVNNSGNTVYASSLSSTSFAGLSFYDLSFVPSVVWSNVNALKVEVDVGMFDSAEFVVGFLLIPPETIDDSKIQLRASIVYRDESGTSYVDVGYLGAPLLYSWSKSDNREFSCVRLQFKSETPFSYEVLSGYKLVPMFSYPGCFESTALSVLQDYASELSVSNVDTSSASYQAGLAQGKLDAFALFENLPLTDREYVGGISVEGFNSSGTSVAGGSQVHYNVLHGVKIDNVDYLEISNITTGVSGVDYWIITLRYSNDRQFVPVSLRSTGGFSLAFNGTTSGKSAQYMGSLYGADFDDLGASGFFSIKLPVSIRSFTFRLLGNSYGTTLDDVYHSGYADGEKASAKANYNAGYNAGVAAGNNYSFFSLISAVVDVPINAVLSLFNLEVFGVNLAPLMTSLLSICLVICIVKFII